MSELVSTARRRELGAALRHLREQRGINGQDMAARLNWTPTTVSRLETGKRTVTPMEVMKYTSACGVLGDEQDALVRLADEPDDYRLKNHAGKIPDELRALMFHESTATTIESFQPTVMPGILQTEDYIRALFEVGGLINPADIEKLMRLRLARRDALTRLRPAQCRWYVHENALRLLMGSPQVMYEQMIHLLFASGRPQCSIRVVPASAGAYGAPTGSFTIFSYLEGAPVVYVEHLTTSEFLESPQDLCAYRATLNRVAKVALTDAESRDFVSWLASEYEQRGAVRDGRPEVLAQEQL